MEYSDRLSPPPVPLLLPVPEARFPGGQQSTVHKHLRAPPVHASAFQTGWRGSVGLNPRLNPERAALMFRGRMQNLEMTLQPFMTGES